MAVILIVDDDQLMVEMIAGALRPLGHCVDTLDDGLHVIDVVHLERPALVILDCTMPQIGGIDALRQIRSSGSCRNTPVMMLTSRRSAADEELARGAGANDYLRKPFGLAQLVGRIDAQLFKAGWKPGAAATGQSEPPAAGGLHPAPKSSPIAARIG
ncbi:MAG: response regulator transcription factor [Sphingomicrobium sp.]